jgi:Icc-related predicted phosphoesterase
MKLKIWHISDTHGFHKQLTIPEGIDLIIHTGDCSNHIDPYQNEWEVKDFLMWYEQVPIPNKIYIPGNHDTSIERNLVKASDFVSRGIHLLIHDWVEIEGIKIFGSPYTPTFGQWSFMKSRETINRVWEQIPEGMDIVGVHGPCKGILDLSYNRQKELEFCGDMALRKHVLNRVKPKYFLSGHIHNFEDIINTGFRYLPDYDITFSNAAAVTDRKFNLGITYNGNVFDFASKVN